MSERQFLLNDPSLISCTLPCGGEYAVSVGGDKIKQLGGITESKRCTAGKAPLRGQHFGLPLHQEHLVQLRACRVCTVYTTVSQESGTGLPSENAESQIDNTDPQA